jgi:hypothetical protein
MSALNKACQEGQEGVLVSLIKKLRHVNASLALTMHHAIKMYI